MRLLGAGLSLVVVGFWLTMNGLLVLRVVEHSGLDGYRRGMLDFLGDRVRRERWMGIYHKRKRIGYSGFVVERRLEKEDLGYSLEFQTEVEVDLFRGEGRMGLGGTLELDARLLPLDLQATLFLGATEVRLRGRREGEDFLVSLGNAPGALRLPLQELHFGDGLAPLPPLANLEVGQTLRVPVLDPIFRERTEAEVSVVSSTSREVDAVVVDCLEILTRYRGSTFRSFVTRDGELLRQEVPPPLDLVLLREPFRPRPMPRPAAAPAAPAGDPVKAGPGPRPERP